MQQNEKNIPLFQFQNDVFKLLFKQNRTKDKKIYFLKNIVQV